MKIKCSIVSGNDKYDVAEFGNSQIFIATPKQFHDLDRKEILITNSINMLILDDVYQLTSLGFQSEIHYIFSNLKSLDRVGLFSTSIPQNFLKTIEEFVKNPKKISLDRKEHNKEEIREFYVEIDKGFISETFKKIYEQSVITKSIIFCNTENDVRNAIIEFITLEFTHISTTIDISKFNELNSKNYENLTIRNLEEFHKGTSTILLTTDDKCHGIDYEQVSIVINYDFPNNYENYLYRIGKAGRFGRKGIVIYFIEKNDKNSLDKLKGYSRTEIKKIEF